MNSSLLSGIFNGCNGSIAPDRGPSEWLLPEQINLIEKWIDQGAKNN